MPRSHTARTRASGWCRKELAHALLHDGERNRQLAELEAESTAYIVCQDLGVDSGSYSFGYVVTWAGGGEEAVAGIKSSCLRIQRAAAFIVDALDGNHPEPSEEPEAASGSDRAA